MPSMISDLLNKKTPILMLAPMEGVTNYDFRSKIQKFGPADVVATEFIRITNSKQKVKKPGEHNCPLQIQLMASDATILEENIKFLKEKDILTDNSWLDLNVGCPSKRVNSRGAGAKLLCEPDKLLKIIDGIRRQHKGALSIKTRVGYQSDEDYPHILDKLKSSSIDMITIHARTRQGKYEEPVNLDYLKLAKAILPFPVIGNGEIWNTDDALTMLKETNVDGLMCGRGAIVNPYLFKEIRSALENKNFKASKLELIEFAKSLLTKYKENPKKIGPFKEFSIWFSKNKLIGKEFFQNIKLMKDFNQIESYLNSF